MRIEAIAAGTAADTYYVYEIWFGVAAGLIEFIRGNFHYRRHMSVISTVENR